MNRAILACAALKSQTESDYNSREMHLLCQSAGADVLCDFDFSRRTPDPQTYTGSGNAENLRMLAYEYGADMIIFSEDLSPEQIKNLESVTGVRVVDRTQLILDIFAARAHSNEGKLQVELAQLQYLLPRLTGKGIEMSRISGGAGVAARGPGETKLETDKRRIRQKISALKKKIAVISDKREIASSGRRQSNIPSACLVGYTSAGKSSLLNLLSGADVFSDEMLFSTLDNTCRRIRCPGGYDFYLTDTVGFLSRLPHSVIAAFRATIREAAECDFLIHVVDCSEDGMPERIKAVNEALGELDITGKPRITVFNKCDLVKDQTRLLNMCRDAENPVVISVTQKRGINELFSCVSQVIGGLFVYVSFVIPYEESGLLSVCHSKGCVLTEEYLDYGTYIEARLPGRVAALLQDYQV